MMSSMENTGKDSANACVNSGVNKAIASSVSESEREEKEEPMVFSDEVMNNSLGPTPTERNIQ